jgi:uncharacterized protein YndB with AHSA1/START domain
MSSETETLVLEHDYAAAPERVFDAWTRVDLLGRWFGCAADKLWTLHEWDVRTGGAIHVSLDFDGQPYEVRGAFLVVDPPRRLKYRWSDDETVEVMISPRGSGSHLELLHSFPRSRDARAILAAGWSHSLRQLGRASPPENNQGAPERP